MHIYKFIIRVQSYQAPYGKQVLSKPQGGHRCFIKRKYIYILYSTIKLFFCIIKEEKRNDINIAPLYGLWRDVCG